MSSHRRQITRDGRIDRRLGPMSIEAETRRIVRDAPALRRGADRVTSSCKTGNTGFLVTNRRSSIRPGPQH